MEGCGGGASGAEISAVSTVSLECSLIFHYLKINIEIGKFHQTIEEISLLFENFNIISSRMKIRRYAAMLAFNMSNIAANVLF